MHSPLRLAPLLLPLLLPTLTGGAAAQGTPTVVSTFETGTEGWSVFNAVAHSQQPTGGNPGGYLHVDNSEGQICVIEAPLAFLGNRSAYIGGTLAFDGRMLGTGGTPWNSFGNYGRVTLFNGGLSISADLMVELEPTTASWTTYSMPLVHTSWSPVNQTTFDTVLGNLTTLRLSVEALFGPEVQGIDNIRLVPPVPAASCTVRIGNGLNPLALSCITAPVLGGTWITAIDLAPGTVATVLVVFGQPLAGVPNPLGAGELLLSPLPYSLYLVGLGSHAVPVPADPSLAGVPFTCQGLRLDGSFALGATNALDLVLGQ
jgi:hypothetical protein